MSLMYCASAAKPPPSQSKCLCACTRVWVVRLKVKKKFHREHLFKISRSALNRSLPFPAQYGNELWKTKNCSFSTHRAPHLIPKMCKFCTHSIDRNVQQEKIEIS